MDLVAQLLAIAGNLFTKQDPKNKIQRGWKSSFIVLKMQ